MDLQQKSLLTVILKNHTIQREGDEVNDVFVIIKIFQLNKTLPNLRTVHLQITQFLLKKPLKYF